MGWCVSEVSDLLACVHMKVRNTDEAISLDDTYFQNGKPCPPCTVQDLTNHHAKRRPGPDSPIVSHLPPPYCLPPSSLSAPDLFSCRFSARMVGKSVREGCSVYTEEKIKCWTSREKERKLTIPISLGGSWTEWRVWRRDVGAERGRQIFWGPRGGVGGDGGRTSGVVEWGWGRGQTL